VEFLVDDLGAEEVDGLAQLGSVERDLVLAKVVRPGHVQQQPEWFFNFNLKGDLDPRAFLPLGLVEQLGSVVELELLSYSLSLPVVRRARVVAGKGDQA